MNIITKKDIVSSLVLTTGVSIGIYLSSLFGYSPHYGLAGVFCIIYLLICGVKNVVSEDK